MAKEGDPLAKKLSSGQLDYNASGDLATAKQKSHRHSADVGVSYDKSVSAGQIDKGAAGAMPTGVHKGAQSAPPSGVFDRSGEFTAKHMSKGKKS